MTEPRACAHCGTAEGELTEFNGRLYCPDCLDDLTLVCIDCGSRFLRTHNRSENDDFPICPECYNRDYTRCVRRGRIIDNPLGRFSYARLPAAVYPHGISQASASAQETFLIASPAKALCDKVMLTPRLRATSRAAMQRYLLEDLRIDAEALQGLDLEVIRAYAACGPKAAQLRALLHCVERMQ